MAKHIHSSAAEEGIEVAAHKDDNFIDNHLDPELPVDFTTSSDDESAAADLTIGRCDDDVAPSATNYDANRKNGSIMKKLFIGATTLLIATTALVVVFIKRPANSTSLFAATAAKRVANNNVALASECCVNTASGTCHATDKCNKRENECMRCNTKTDDTYIWQTAPTLPEPSRGGTVETPCCVNIATNTCHVITRCNKDGNNCLNKKCQKNGVSSWMIVPSKVSPAPTPATPTPPPPTPTSPAPGDDATVYDYTNTGTSCNIGGVAGGGDNIQGPAPLPDKRNVAVDFWAFGDSPYDFLVNTCLDSNGNPSTCKNCAVKNSQMNKLPISNTCTFEGADYKCLRENIIPFMNRKMEGGDGAFQIHVGDILKGNESGSSRRCTQASFDSRVKLFQPAKNFLLINGDNESNECLGYDITQPSDPIRDMWRNKFGTYSFTSDFPEITGGGRPTISRVAGNEEIFSFEYKNIAFFGLDYPAGDTYITKKAPQDLNAKFVKETLDSDTSCELKSIVMFSHIAPRSPVDDALNDYFNVCERVLPTLVVMGNAHPSTYCLTRKGERFSLTVEAFKSGPLMVSVVRDPKEGGGDYFHVTDSDLKNSNSDCPTFA